MRLGKTKMVIGYELGNDTSQVSFCRTDQSMPDTLSLVQGKEQYNIPTLLCKAHGKWYIGNEALDKSREEGATLVEDMVLLAKNGTNIWIDDKERTPAELLSVFIKKTILMIMPITSIDDIAQITFTLKNMDKTLMEALERAFILMKLENAKISFMSRPECFFQYIVHQEQSMWANDVMLFDYQREGMTVYHFEQNSRSKPVASFVDVSHESRMRLGDIDRMNDSMKNAYFMQSDETFLEIAKSHMDGKRITSVFLIGDIFASQWCKSTLKYLCNGRRVFQGNNLFSKGACYGAKEKIAPTTISEDYAFLGDDKLKANIGMQCNKGSQEIYYPLLSAGNNWYESQAHVEAILAKDNKLSLVITSLLTGTKKVAEITLEGLKVRGNRTNRVGLSLSMPDKSTVQIEISDLGFGDFYESSNQIWKEEFTV